MTNKSLFHFKMTTRPSRPSKVRFGGSYDDRIPLEEDFETVSARTGSLSGPNNFPMNTDRSSVSSSWTYGDSWAPEDSDDFSLDPDQGWYDEAVEADIADVMEELVIPQRRRNRSQASVCTISNMHIISPQLTSRHDHMYSGRLTRATNISARCYDMKGEATSLATHAALIVFQEELRSLLKLNIDAAAVFCRT